MESVLGQEDTEYPEDDEAVHLPVPIDRRPVRGDDACDNLGQRSREGETDRCGRPEHGRPPPTGPAESEEHSNENDSGASTPRDEPFPGRWCRVALLGTGEVQESRQTTSRRKHAEPFP